MLFPAPRVTPSTMPTQEDSMVANPYQWQKFDNLFDQVFAPTQKAPPPPPPPSAPPFGGRRLETHPASDLPGGFRRGRMIGTDEESDIQAHGDFDSLWNNALRKTKKTTTTTTRRRIIRHTPEMDMPLPPSPIISNNGLHFPRPTLPHTKYPSSEQSDSDSDSMPMPSTPPRLIGGLPSMEDQSLLNASPASSVSSHSLTSDRSIRRERSK
jgi:hypothetical protein